MNFPHVDSQIRPQDDFFRFVNGKWLDSIEIPKDRERWGSFDELRKRTDELSQQLLDEILSGDIDATDAEAKKMVDFVRVAMDEEQIKKVALGPIQDSVEEIMAITSVAELRAYLVESNANGKPSLWSASVFASMADSKMYAWYIGAGALGLPEREYYLAQDEEHRAIRADYLQYIDEVATMVGWTNIQPAAVLAFETDVAKTLLSKEESRNPQNIFNPTGLDTLEQEYQAIPWRAIYDTYDLPLDLQPIITEIAYFEALGDLIDEHGIDVVRQYLLWSLVNSASKYTVGELEDRRFAFYGKRLGGAEVMRPRSERVLAVINGVLGEALGKLYVSRYFSAEAKAKAELLVELVKEAFANRMKAVEWMTENTKQKALLKLGQLSVKVGYPDKWKDYSDLQVVSLEDGGSYLANMQAVSKFLWRRDLARIGQSVDTSEWYMAPQVVNAYYNPLANEIVFPAAILQSPFYDKNRDMALNFGGIGAVIAHEITHGFDDQGRRFDAQGNLVEWWSAQDLDDFTQRGKRLIEQANAFEILPGLSLNGEYTLGENLADLGGVLISYDALQLYYERYGREEGGGPYSGEQMFFISWATVWRGKTREEALRKQIATDPHPPFEFRAINPLRNIEAFYKAWHVGQDDKMYLRSSDRARVW